MYFFILSFNLSMCPLKLRFSAIYRTKYLKEGVLGISLSPTRSLDKFVLGLGFLGEYSRKGNERGVSYNFPKNFQAKMNKNE